MTSQPVDGGGGAPPTRKHQAPNNDVDSRKLVELVQKHKAIACFPKALEASAKPIDQDHPKYGWGTFLALWLMSSFWRKMRAIDFEFPKLFPYQEFISLHNREVVAGMLVRGEVDQKVIDFAMD